MKTQTSIWLAVIVVLLLAAVCWLRNSKRVMPEKMVNTATSTDVTTRTLSVPIEVTNQSLAVELAETAKAYRQGLVSKEEAIQKVLELENLKSLDFYGEVVDQHGNPVVGAKVRGGVGLNVDFVHSGGKNYYTETDAQGKFRFVGIHGAGIGIWLEKIGYECDRSQNEQRPSNYSQHDPKNPVVFTMWKLKGPDPMVHSKIQTVIPCDGTAVSFDLLTGKKANSGGDFTIKLLRDPVNIVRGKPFSWSVTLEIPNGGIDEIANIYPYEAPSDGYRSSITTNIPPATDMKDFADALTRSYYFKCRNGQVYGRMKIQIQADFQPPPTFFSAEIYVNPSGSRNLEYDRAKEIEPSQVLQRQTNQ